MTAAKRRSVGDIELGRVFELMLPLPVEYFYPDVGADEFAPYADWLTAEGAYNPDDGRILLPVQSYLVRTSHHTILVDSCIGNDKHRPEAFWHHKQDPAYLDNLAAHGVGVADIDYVMCTHLHMDHVGWNTRLDDGRWVPTFPNARYLFSAADVAAGQASEDEWDAIAFAESVQPILEAGQADLVEADHVLDDEVWLEPTPGHTPGHYAVRLASSGHQAVIGGDLMHSPVQCLHPEWRARPDWDPDMARQTRRSFMERHAEAGTLVVMAHFPLPSAGQFQADGDAFRFVYDQTDW